VIYGAKIAVLAKQNCLAKGPGLQCRDDRESRFAIFLPRILWKMRLASHKNISTSLASLTRREKCDILCNLRDSQTSKIIIHSEKLVLDPKFWQDSRKAPELKLVMIFASLTTKFLFARLASLAAKFICKTRESRFEICLWGLQEASLATKFLSARLVRSDPRNEISLPNSLLAILTMKFLSAKLARSESRYYFWLASLARTSREFWVLKASLASARISKSDSRVNPNHQESRKSTPNYHVNARYRVHRKWRFQFLNSNVLRKLSEGLTVERGKEGCK
jgi:hypothetical protein